MRPEISVVMGVYNGATALVATLESILDQHDCDFEVIVVDDGSNDDTPIVAARYAAMDPRVRVMHLRHVGLTRALIAGCASARGDFIARQDCGDRSLPGRLARQRAILAEQCDTVLVAVGTRYVGPDAEWLYEIAPGSGDLRRGLAQTSVDSVRGPSHHGATMFRKSAYEVVGGYRSAFSVAQDIDLWLRLFEVGGCVAIPEIFYEASLAMGAISLTRRQEQLHAAEAILAAARCRRSGSSDTAIVAQWLENGAGASATSTQAEDASSFYYFLGSVLQNRDPLRASDYFRQALGHSIWRPKIWFRLAKSSFEASLSKLSSLSAETK